MTGRREPLPGKAALPGRFLLSDFKPLLALYYRQIADLNIGDAGKRRTLVQNSDEGMYPVCRPFGLELDGAVRSIANPAAQTGTGRLITDKVPEPDALHSAQNPCADSRAGADRSVQGPPLFHGSPF